ncbi:hypothetical protein IHE45_17G064300 [Dioscorea alata]|uniref:Uncharacterized protein n=1 Tax=Dioscorea alata TaxID=55571 RepID=A0ACB7UCT3_DIOAL|nr:hypothetical protein IHE45_17G064300 [Dioscorea alata]
MAGAPRVRSMNAGDIEARPILVPAGNKARLVTRKPVSKPPPKVEAKKLQIPVLAVDSPPSSPALSPPALLRRHELLFHSNLSMNASCSSDASTESFCSRASTGRIGRMGFTGRRRQSVLRAEKICAKP